MGKVDPQHVNFKFRQIVAITKKYIERRKSRDSLEDR